ncbi:hypothetical protein [Bartonella tribocorum]|uniref:hypothetical protein n=1 Tax=Bartonella tribocorum TaxID=85701 RepID=UPI001179DFAB|nr:hypothetical protein [Bartonella tribocorum]
MRTIKKHESQNVKKASSPFLKKIFQPSNRIKNRKKRWRETRKHFIFFSKAFSDLLRVTICKSLSLIIKPPTPRIQKLTRFILFYDKAQYSKSGMEAIETIEIFSSSTKSQTIEKCLINLAQPKKNQKKDKKIA